MIRASWTYRVVSALAAMAFAMPAVAQYNIGKKPGESLTDPAIPEVGIDQQLGKTVPLDIAFRNEAGEAVTLGDYFGKDRPVVVAMVYYECPMLCGEVLNGMLDSFKDLDYTIGQEFDVLAISFNPEETAELAAAKKKIFVENYGRESAASNWHFLTGEAAASSALANALGFGYEYLPDAGEYAHGSAIMVLTPEGEISKYLFGVTYPADDVRTALLAAGQGRIGSVAEQVVYRCFLYNSATGQYTVRIMYLVRMAGLATMAFLAVVVGMYLRRDRKARRRREAANGHVVPSH